MAEPASATPPPADPVAAVEAARVRRERETIRALLDLYPSAMLHELIALAADARAAGANGRPSPRELAIEIQFRADGTVEQVFVPRRCAW